MFSIRVATLVIALTIASAVANDEPKQLRDARREYESLAHPSEAARVRYITRLVRLRESFTRADYKMMEVIDAEVIRHPMPATADSGTLSKRVVGQWTSPRHQYLYRANGTWTMLPVEDAETTHGVWHIEANKFFQNASVQLPDSGETIILLSATDFVWGTKRAPYYMRRGDVFPWR